MIEDSPAKRQKVDDGVNGTADSSSVPNTGTTTASKGIFEALTARVAHLESVLGVRQTSQHDSELSRHAGNTRHVHEPSYKAGSPSRQNILSGVFPEAHAFVKSFLHSPTDSRVAVVASDLRQLHETLKLRHRSQRSLMSAMNTNVEGLIPPLTVCRRLTEIYFGNLEHCFRILHRSSFDRELEEYFSTGNVSPEFLPQLVGVISVSAILGITSECQQVADAYDSHLIRVSVKYIEGHLSSLSYKQRHTLPAFQTKSMLVLLRTMRLDKTSELWELTGELLRQALVMGMDQDPSERSETFTAFEAEMRRKLWISTVEWDMLMGLLANMPCTIPDYTCKPPKNLDDDELLLDNLDLRPSRPYDQWTDSLCQCFLADSLAQRLHGCKDLQSNPDHRYDHVLRHTRAIEKVLKNLPPPLRFTARTDDPAKATARLMARMEVDITLRRPLMHLYTPFAYANDEKDEYAEARAGFLQSCLMVTSYQDLFDPKYSELHVERPVGYWDFFFNVYVREISQSLMGLCLEIRRLAKSHNPIVSESGETGFRMPAYSRTSITKSVRDVFEPMTRRISHVGADLKDLAYLTTVYNSVRFNQPTENAMIEGLEEMAASCKLQLEKDHIPMSTTYSVEPSSSLPTPGFDFDPSWMNIPIFADDAFFTNGEPFTLYTP